MAVITPEVSHQQESPLYEERFKTQNVEQAVNGSLERAAFKETVELHESQAGYYTEHYALGQAVATVIETDPSLLEPSEREEQMALLDNLSIESRGTADFDVEFEQLIKNGLWDKNRDVTGPLLIAVRAARLVDPEDAHLKRTELQLALSISSGLFSEAGVGVTALAEEDIQAAQEMYSEVARQAEEAGMPRELIESYPPPAAAIEAARTIFWQDIRHAGQLLFHHTANFPQVWQSGALMPRRMQQRQGGTVRTVNAMQMNGAIWSPMVHWNEKLSPRVSLENEVVIGVPIEQVVRQAPYGRDAHYGVLELKEEYAESLTEVPTLAEVGYHGDTGDTGQGPIGSKDRSFYSSPHDVAPDAPLEIAPDGHSFSLYSPEIRLITVGKEEAEITSHYGRGEFYPTPSPILAQKTKSEIDKAPKDVEAEIKAELKALQDESIARHWGRLVVPLRSGVFDFALGDELRGSRKPRPQFAQVR